MIVENPILKIIDLILFQFVEKIVDPNFATHLRARIHRAKTSNDYKDYGATYSLQEDHGTAHINVLAPNGDAVSATSSINHL